jgi:hypothetical protein
MELIFKPSNKALIRKVNKAIKLGQYFPCSGVAQWATNSTDNTFPYSLAKLQACVSRALSASFVSSNFIPALTTAFSEDAPYYDPEYKWAYTEAITTCTRFAKPEQVSGRTYAALTLDFYDSGGTLAEFSGTSDNPVLAYGNNWTNPNYPILMGVCITSSLPSTPNAAGTPLFTIDMNQATAAAVSGNAGITDDGMGYWPIFYDSVVPQTITITDPTFLSAIASWQYIYVTVKPVYLNQFYIPTNYSRVLHKQACALQEPYIYIYA